ncbi:MAG: hypothetical protein SAK29_24830, partial [Scytonema sp. PMC 1069.18]|nr:hypothetical protein [Scytonema sp. PMC 1069.18]
MKELERIKIWCALHNPIEIQPASGNKEKNISMAAIIGVEQPVVANAQIAGDWRLVLAKDDALRKVLSAGGIQATPEQYEVLLKAFKDSPATGCTTVMDMARISTGFNPAAPLQEGNYSAFIDYVNTLTSSPFFEVYPSSNEEYRRVNEDWNRVVDDIVNYYQGITDADRGRVRMSLYQLIQAAVSRRDSWQSQTLFVQNTVQATNNNLIVFIYQSNVAIIEHGRKRTSTETFFKITKIILKFYVEHWVNYAELVIKTHIKLVRDWLDENSTQGALQFSAVINDESCLNIIPSLADSIRVGNPNEYWSSFGWDEFDPQIQGLLEILGWNCSNWEGPESVYPLSYYKSWNELTLKEKQAAKKLNYCEDN